MRHLCFIQIDKLNCIDVDLSLSTLTSHLIFSSKHANNEIRRNFNWLRIYSRISEYNFQSDVFASASFGLSNCLKYNSNQCVSFENCVFFLCFQFADLFFWMWCPIWKWLAHRHTETNWFKSTSSKMHFISEFKQIRIKHRRRPSVCALVRNILCATKHHSLVLMNTKLEFAHRLAIRSINNYQE